MLVNCTRYGEDIDSMIAEIIRIDENDELYRDMRRQAPFKEKYSTKKLEEFLCNVAEEAKRGKMDKKYLNQGEKIYNRMNSMFKSVSEVNGVVGNNISKEEIYHHFQKYEDEALYY